MVDFVKPCIFVLTLITYEVVAASTFKPTIKPTSKPTVLLPQTEDLLHAVNVYDYTGKSFNITVPLETTSIYLYMWGGGGGASIFGKTYGGAGAYVEGMIET